MRSVTEPDARGAPLPAPPSEGFGIPSPSRLVRFDEAAFSSRPWLILGKGPSYSKIVTVDVTRFNILTMNHVVERVASCEIAHFADWEAFLDCADAAVARARFVCMPYFPFVRFRPSTRSLLSLAEDSPPLKSLLGQGRVLTYNLGATTVGGVLDGFPRVELQHFSAEAVIDYLGKSGVRRIASLGVDGGKAYSSSFANLIDRTLLASGQPTYDYQFDGIVHALLRNRVDYAPLDLRTPIETLIRHSPPMWLAAAVLGFSVRRNCPVTMAPRLLQGPRASRRMRNAEHGGVRLRSGGQCLLELDARSLVVGSLMPLMRRAFSEPAGPPQDLCWAPRRHPGTHGDPSAKAPWFRRLVRERIVMFQRSADYPWRYPDCEWSRTWMRALREAVYWKQISIRQIRREIAIGHVSPAIFESMERLGPPEPPSWNATVGDTGGTG